MPVNWGNGARGAASGAALGATIGNGYGAVIGGVIGGGIGLFTGGDDDVTPTPVSLPFFYEDRDRLGGMLEGKDPYAGREWGALIKELQDRAAGVGGSVAGNAYKQASQDAQNGLASLSQNSASPGAARQAMLQAGHIQQGLAQGYANQALQEQQANQSMLGNALTNRDNINSKAYLSILEQQLALSRAQMQAAQGNQAAEFQAHLNQQQQDAQQLAAYGTLSAALGKTIGSKPVSGKLSDEDSPGPVTKPGQDPSNPYDRYKRPPGAY